MSDHEEKAPSPPSYHKAVKGGYELTLAEDFHAGFSIKIETATQVRIQGAPGARAPPLTLGFEAPKLSIFGPYLIFP